MPTFSWTQLCTDERRLIASTEAANLYGGLAPGHEPAHAFAALVADSRWRTLVIEHVQQEQRWSDLWEGAFATFWDKLGNQRLLAVALKGTHAALVGGPDAGLAGGVRSLGATLDSVRKSEMVSRRPES